MAGGTHRRRVKPEGRGGRGGGGKQANHIPRVSRKSKKDGERERDFGDILRCKVVFVKRKQRCFKERPGRDCL